VTQARSHAEPAPDASRAVRRVRGSLAAEVRERLRRAIALAPQAQTSQGLRFETARLHFGTPVVPSGPPTPDNVAAQVERVRGALARLIDVGRAARRHVFV
jgi:hypothetical protein